MIRKAAAMLLSIGIALPGVAITTTPASAENGFVNFLRGGREPIRHGKFRSNKSPVPRKTVRFDKYPANTIFIDTAERRLYYSLGNGKAIRYGVGVGRDGFRWSGSHKITRKAEWPGWTPPAVMRARVKRQTGRTLPAYVPGGEDNPLGARALYIGSTIYRIHGTNQPWTIGKAMSSGCIRMANDDVMDLYQRVGVGTRVVVRQ
ncbi:L,D-transpeptidase [Notoacmeibacter sp. MSK16QG-6]|uniref:L,D-transpeptidase n=1 Tax=Notoacmeibacter sp. MSK16QG-6 TaxID=2957982 RepID=UPI0020A04651|nr:L,D-transpeptidase [Notoacmeibacter sp. MSK16QG-6]MCP1199477.1 L,D-transpeptidase [Notoacmeibacter sp. MSK16QG-6]